MYMIQIYHPETKGVAKVSERAFERIYKGSGWIRMEDALETHRGALDDAVSEYSDAILDEENTGEEDDSEPVEE